MEQPAAPIGVVIVSYNTSALLRACLLSLRSCTLPLRVVVVDNASPDGSAAMVRAEFPAVELCAQRRNLGFAAGTNEGLRRLGYREQRTANSEQREAKAVLGSVPFVLLLNPDTVVHAGAIEAMAAFLAAHPRVGMVGPRLLNPDGSVQPAAFRFPTLSMSLIEMFPPGEVLPGRLYNSWWHGRYPAEGRAGEPFPIDHPLGACMMVRGAAITAAGLLDERYFMYSEEIEWCWRIRRAGWAIWQAPAARVTHVGGAATRQFRRRMLVELHRSRVCFFRQHYSPSFLRAHRAITRAGMARAALLAWLAYARGRISRADLRERLLGYAEIAAL